MSDPVLPTSRYYTTPVRIDEDEGGDGVPFLGRRIIPARDRFVPLGHVDLAGNERIDALAAERMGDPLLYWRIVDADGADDPARGTSEPRKRLMLPLPLEASGDGDT